MKGNQEQKYGKLYICPTPIGNLEDITLRVLRVLREVDIIAAEDTRRTIKLLNHFEISKKMISYHEHNKLSSGSRITDLLKEGMNIGLVTDAGMPGISDPGYDIIKEVIESGIEFEVLPGACALINALVGSGLETDEFMFTGFLGRDKKSLEAKLEPLKSLRATLIFYEAPHRLVKTLKMVLDILGDRNIVLCRELTKKHEEFVRLKISEIIYKYQMQEEQPRGEMVIVVEGFKGEELPDKLEDADIDNISEEEIFKMFSEAQKPKDVVKSIMKKYNLSKNRSYELMLKWRDMINWKEGE